MGDPKCFTKKGGMYPGNPGCSKHTLEKVGIGCRGRIGIQKGEQLDSLLESGRASKFGRGSGGH